jgi:hypothetical protein
MIDDQVFRSERGQDGALLADQPKGQIEVAEGGTGSQDIPGVNHQKTVVLNVHRIWTSGKVPWTFLGSV